MINEMINGANELESRVSKFRAGVVEEAGGLDGI